MKVLYLASNPQDAATLRLEQEITELQRYTVAISGDNVQFVFLPNLPFEDLPSEVAKHRPDVVHISAHGDFEALSLAHGEGKDVALTGEMLANFLNVEPVPRLAYLSACNSEDLAKELSQVVPIVVGTTAAITNRAARKSALAFYGRLLEGRSVKSAFDTARLVMEGVDASKVSTRLFAHEGVDPNLQFLHVPTRLIARFRKDRFAPVAGDTYEIELGLVGAPRNTSQVVFFTDDETFITDPDDLENLLCSVYRGTPVAGEIWLEEPWTPHGDFRVYACGATAGGDHFSVAGTLCGAIETFYKASLPGTASKSLPKKLQRAIASLKRFDGAQLGRAKF